MKGKARRLLSWVCVLALCMSLLPVTALATTGSGTQKDPVTNTENQVTVNKWVTGTGTEDNPYTLTMEAYASNVVTTESKTTPLDIVLVLDQSGSMSDSYHSSWWYGDSKLSMLKEAATSFVKKVAQNAQENEVSHRIAVVGFASTGNKYSGYKNTGLFVDRGFKNYGDLSSSDYKTHWFLQLIINGLSLRPSTPWTQRATPIPNTGWIWPTTYSQTIPIQTTNAIVWL